ncbi:MAG TPA: alkaline phosphatase family protein [Polyangiales bacterium]
MTPDELKQNVETIAIVMMENRSFDHVLGHLRAPQFGNMQEVEGIANLHDPNFVNPNLQGVGYAPYFAPDAGFVSDLPHGERDVATQLAPSLINGSFGMNGFVKAFELKYHTSVERPPPLHLLDPSGAPVTSALAQAYTLCDHWFASIPTYTAPNRLMALCGYYTKQKGPLLPNQDTVYEWLSKHGVRWRVYSAGFPFITLMPKFLPMLLTTHFRRLEQLPQDLASEPPDQRPQVIFIEPEYYDTPVHLGSPCDNHPPLSMAPGEAFVAKVYGWLSAHQELWSKLVMILNYDEHGGFWDHVPPPRISYHNASVTFSSTGPRVPGVLVGPFAPRRVCKTTLDNTAVLQLLADRFGKPGELYSAEVAARARAGIGSIAKELALGAPAAAKPLPLVQPAPPKPAQPNTSSSLYQGYDQATRQLLLRHRAEALQKYPELAKLH